MIKAQKRVAVPSSSSSSYNKIPPVPVRPAVEESVKVAPKKSTPPAHGDKASSNVPSLGMKNSLIH
jgi:hypothetical protein